MDSTKEKVLEGYYSLSVFDKNWVRQKINGENPENNGCVSIYDPFIQRFKNSSYVFEELSEDDAAILSSSSNQPSLFNHLNSQEKEINSKTISQFSFNHERGIIISDPLRSCFFSLKESQNKTQTSSLRSSLPLCSNSNQDDLNLNSLSKTAFDHESVLNNQKYNDQNKSKEENCDRQKRNATLDEVNERKKVFMSSETSLQNGSFKKNHQIDPILVSDDSESLGEVLNKINSSHVNKSLKKPDSKQFVNTAQSDNDSSLSSDSQTKKLLLSSSKKTLPTHEKKFSDFSIKKRSVSSVKMASDSAKKNLVSPSKVNSCSPKNVVSDTSKIEASIDAVVKASRNFITFSNDSTIRVKRVHSLSYKQKIERLAKKFSLQKKQKKTSSQDIFSYQYLLESSSENDVEISSFYSSSDDNIDNFSISSIDSSNEKNSSFKEKIEKARARKEKIMQKLIHDPKLKMKCQVKLTRIPQCLLNADLNANDYIKNLKNIDPFLLSKNLVISSNDESSDESSSEDDVVSRQNLNGFGSIKTNQFILSDSSDDELDDQDIVDDSSSKIKKKCLKKHQKRKRIDSSSSSSSDVSEEPSDSDDKDEKEDKTDKNKETKNNQKDNKKKDKEKSKFDSPKKSLAKEPSNTKKTEKNLNKKRGKICNKDVKSKRKRKKQDENDFPELVEISSDEENENKNMILKSETEAEKTFSKGRKNIRKPISEKQLSAQTREAKKKEEERIKRINEKKQLEYNELETNKKDTLNSLVLDYDSNSKKTKVEVNSKLVKFVKKHQYEGIKFMWDCAVESVERLKDGHGSGCILAHCMGLGKTFQVITFLYTLFTNNLTKTFIKNALIIVPVNTLQNWRAEFDKWIENEGLEQLKLHEMGDAKTYCQRETILSNWKNAGGVLIIGHNSFNALLHGKIQTKGESVCKLIEETLVDPGPDIVIVDEGHTLKNDASNFNKAVSTIKTLRRIILTGTPLQNNLMEYHVMVNFVKPNLLGSKKEFTNRFFNPINNGQHEDSTKEDVKLMKQKIHVLNHLLRGCVQRFDFDILRPYLQHKYEYTVFIQPTDFIIDMYHYYVDNNPRRSLLKDAQNLRFICNHPGILFYTKGHKIYQDSKTSKTVSAITSAPLKSLANNQAEKDSISFKTDDKDFIDNTLLQKKDLDDIEILHNSELVNNDELVDDDELQFLNSWYGKYIPLIDKDAAELSGKFSLLLKILDECVIIGDKAIVVSQCLGTLNLIERHLSRRNGKILKVGREKMKVYWKKNINYFRIDGSIDSFDRHSYVKSFNDPNNSKARLFLLATRAGGVGINLVGANRCIIFDVSWNPTNDLQAIFRIYRFGQEKPVYIYRFVTKGTIEEKIYQKQIVKLGLSMRVVDKQNVERHYTKNELEAFYNKPQSHYERSMLPPKDKLLGDLILNENPHIVGYQEHDSLLQAKPEEDLSEEERAFAWAEYEREKDEEYKREEELKRRREEMGYQETLNQMNEQVFRELNKFTNCKSYSNKPGETSFVTSQPTRHAVFLQRASNTSSANLLLPHSSQTFQQRILPQTFSQRFNSIPSTHLINPNFQNHHQVSPQKNLMRFPILHNRPPQPFIVSPTKSLNLRSTNILPALSSTSNINPAQSSHPEIITPHSDDDLLDSGIERTNNIQRSSKNYSNLREIFKQAAITNDLSLSDAAIEGLIKGRLGDLNLLTCRSDDFIKLSFKSHSSRQPIETDEFLMKLLSEIRTLQNILKSVSIKLTVKPKTLMTTEETNFISICGSVINKLQNHERTIVSSRDVVENLIKKTQKI